MSLRTSSRSIRTFAAVLGSTTAFRVALALTSGFVITLLLRRFWLFSIRGSKRLGDVDFLSWYLVPLTGLVDDRDEASIRILDVLERVTRHLSTMVGEVLVHCNPDLVLAWLRGDLAVRRTSDDRRKILQKLDKIARFFVSPEDLRLPEVAQPIPELLQEAFRTRQLDIQRERIQIIYKFSLLFEPLINIHWHEIPGGKSNSIEQTLKLIEWFSVALAFFTPSLHCIRKLLNDFIAYQFISLLLPRVELRHQTIRVWGQERHLFDLRKRFVGAFLPEFVISLHV